MELLPEPGLEELRQWYEEEQQRFIECQGSFRLASEERILGLLEAPLGAYLRGTMAAIAASVGRGGLLLRALERGVLSPDAQYDAGTVVHLAAEYGPVELLKSLVVERGVDPNEARTDVWRPLPIAIDNGREQEAIFLINEAPGVDIDAPIPGNLTPLMLAAAYGMMDVLRALVAKGAVVNAINDHGGAACSHQT